MIDPSIDGLPAPGDVLGGKYRVTRLLGRGGMGAVFAAQHEMLGEEVAIKLMLAEAMREPEAVKRFVNEARAAAKIRGEHVVRVLDVGVLDDGRPYISMELMEGEDLGQLLEKNGPLPMTVAVDYLLQGMEAIAQAHALGVVHRDLKPSNFFLATRLDGSRIVKVLDFGIAKATGGGIAGQAMTSTRAMMGSPLYMSPEQIRSSKSVDPQSDLWALGVIAYELIDGAPPFNGETVGELFFAIVEQTPPPIHTRKPGIAPGLSAVVARCLERDKALRFRTVVDLARALRPFASASGALEVDRIATAFDRASARGGLVTGGSSPDVAQASPSTGHASVGRGAPAQFISGPSSPGLSDVDRAGPPAMGPGLPANSAMPAQTNGSWAQSGALSAPPRSLKAPVALAIAVGIALLGAMALLVVSLTSSRTRSAAAAPSAAASAAFLPAAANEPAPPVETAAATPPAAPITSAASAPSASAEAIAPARVVPSSPATTVHDHPRRNAGPAASVVAPAKPPELLKDRNAF